MTDKAKPPQPMAFKNLAELKRYIKLGTEFKATRHKYHPDIVGLTRVVTKVQTNGFYSKIKDEPNHRFSDCNGGKGFFTELGKAGGYIFDGTAVKVLDKRGENGVIYELEFYRENTEVNEMNEYDRLHRQAQRYKELYDRPTTFTYCDPPYFTSEYVYDCGFTWEDHLRLYHALAGMKGKFLLSYNDCPEIRELYKEYNFFDFKRVHSMAQKYEAGKEFPELLIANYDLFERERQQPHQLTLFDVGDKPLDYEKILKENIVCRIKR